MSTSADPRNDRIVKFNDGKWHHVMALRERASGYIVVDGYYEGTAVCLGSL